MRLLLWDIDGTLVSTGIGNLDTFARAFGEVNGVEATREGLDVWGRTDLFLAEALFQRHGIPMTEEKLHAIFEIYLAGLEKNLAASPGKIHPGILDILEIAHHRPDLVQGLLTGNLRRGAQIKLERHQLWHYFEFGAFADDSGARNELGPFALQRAKDRHGKAFASKDVFIIGDTPHDIECAKVIGAHSIAVATGRYTVEELAAHQPTALLPNLGDPAAFFAIVDGAIAL